MGQSCICSCPTFQQPYMYVCTRYIHVKTTYNLGFYHDVRVHTMQKYGNAIFRHIWVYTCTYNWSWSWGDRLFQETGSFHVGMENIYMYHDVCTAYSWIWWFSQDCDQLYVHVYTQIWRNIAVSYYSIVYTGLNLHVLVTNEYIRAHTTHSKTVTSMY